VLFYRAALPLSRQTLPFVSGIIRRHRKAIDSRQISAPALRRPILSQAVMLCVMVYGGEVTYMTDPSPRSPRATMTIKRW